LELLETTDGVVLNLWVKPKSDRFEIQLDNDELVVLCKSPPRDGKANREIIRELSKVFKKEVLLISGFSSKRKRILVKNGSVDEIRRVLSSIREKKT
jgi:hypothetical protein